MSRLRTRQHSILRHIRQTAALLVVVTIAVVGLSVIAPARSNAAAPSAASQSCGGSFLGLETWYHYLGREMDSNCNVNCFNVLPLGKDSSGNLIRNQCGQNESDVPLVALAIVDDLLRIAGLVAVGFIIYAAIGFITSQGNAEDAAKARGTAINALIGLLIAMVAVVLVSFIGNKLGG